MTLSHRKAKKEDLATIVQLLKEDEWGCLREGGTLVDTCYLNAFERIQKDPNQYLMVVEQDKVLIATCHLTLMPSLTFKGSLRMQIEAVRVAHECRGQQIGRWMLEQAFLYAKKNQVDMIQLTTNKMRSRALKFYEKLGFEASHEGMKIYLNQQEIFPNA